jgi:hypothetical protein
MSMNIRRFLVMGKLTAKNVGPRSFLTFSFPDDTIGREELKDVSECKNIWQQQLLDVVADFAKFGIADPSTCFVDAPGAVDQLQMSGAKAGAQAKRNAVVAGNAGLVVHAKALAQLKKNFETEEFNFKNNNFKLAWQGSGKIGGIVQHLEMMYLVANHLYTAAAKGKRVMSDLLNWANVLQAATTYSVLILAISFRLHEYLLTIAVWALAVNMLSYRFMKKIKRIRVKTRHKNLGDYINMAVYASSQVSTATHILSETNRLMLKLRCLMLGTSKNNSMRFVWFLCAVVLMTSVLPLSWFMIIVIVLNFVAAYNVVGIWQRVGVWWDQVGTRAYVRVCVRAWKRARSCHMQSVQRAPACLVRLAVARVRVVAVGLFARARGCIMWVSGWQSFVQLRASVCNRPSPRQ